MTFKFFHFSYWLSVNTFWDILLIKLIMIFVLGKYLTQFYGCILICCFGIKKKKRAILLYNFKRDASLTENHTLKKPPSRLCPQQSGLSAVGWDLRGREGHCRFETCSEAKMPQAKGHRNKYKEQKTSKHTYQHDLHMALVTVFLNVYVWGLKKNLKKIKTANANIIKLSIINQFTFENMHKII